MIVIADTGPINYLILIGEIETLPILFQRVAIPSSVLMELSQPRTPTSVQNWISHPPGWFEVLTPSLSPDENLLRLDAGERDAILLAEELQADLLIIDEARGRREAHRRQMPYTGTLGVLTAAAERGLLDLPSAVDRLRQTSFHISPEILDRLIRSK